ncbi:hypothetical protein KBC31_01845 [Candidatus Saccharibacteria bacterium]|nr:hypothetical protein [Candidatus Saccharibacteria bacterium]
MADEQNTNEPLIQAPAGMAPPPAPSPTDGAPSIIKKPENARAGSGLDTNPATPPRPTFNPPKNDGTIVTVNASGLNNTPSSTPGNHGDLASLREQALEQLRPLLDEATLDATEKFDIYMRLIHTSNDSGLLKKAHEVAAQIEDNDERARALFDVVTEIDFQLHDQDQAE